MPQCTPAAGPVGRIPFEQRRPLLLLLSTILGCAGDPVETRAPPPVDDTAPPPPAGDPLLRFADGEAPANVLMISIDTLRRDAIGRYGDGDLTPFLDDQLPQMVTLDRHQQCSNWTFPSTLCTLNGRYHEENGFLPKLGEELRAPVPDGQQTVATHLRDAGFYTMLVSTNAWLSPTWNNAQGYVETPDFGYGNGTYLTTEAFDRLAEVQADGDAERWLVHVHWVEPHVPYNPPAHLRIGEDELDPIEWDLSSMSGHYDITDRWSELSADEQALLEDHLRVRYDGEVRWVDAQLASLWQQLSDDGWLDDTLVILWTDHGEQFWEHGEQSHAHSLYAEENDALLAFWAPDLAPVAWDEPTHGIDLLPSVLDALQLPVPDDLPGAPVGTARPDRPTFTVVSARDGAVQAVTRGDWKLHFNWSGQVELFDRSVDPGETRDRFAPDHPEAAPLWSLLLPHIVALQPLVPERTLTWPEGLTSPP